MSSFLDRLNAAAGSAVCAILDQGGSALITAGVWPLNIPQGRLALLGGGAAALLASRYLCEWDPEKPTTLPPSNNPLIQGGQCLETTGCGLTILDSDGAVYRTVQKLVSIFRSGSYPNGTPKITITYVNCDGETIADDESLSRAPFSTVLEPGFECGGEVSKEPDPEWPITIYQEGGDANCTIKVETLGFATVDGYNSAPVFRMSPVLEEREGNSGGVISGCNFAPVIYYSPGGGGGGGNGGDGDPPIYYGPEPEDKDEDEEAPWWLDLLNNIIGGAIGGAVFSALNSFLTTDYEGGTYVLEGPCERDANGDPVEVKEEIEIPTAATFESVLYRLDALAELLQAHKNFRQPVCYVKPGEGNARTIWFQSEEKSPAGNDFLRKRFSYRSKGSMDLGDLIDYWKDFEFTSGPVVVSHRGSSLGFTQVWGFSVDEGKRVIRHAAAEAGVNPDKDGEWQTGSCGNARYGLPMTMRVMRKGGFWHITDREGASNRPIVGKVDRSDL